jgi:hypothetical protein
MATKSAGHICFTSDGKVEFFEVDSPEGKQVYRAQAAAPLTDARDTRRHGRWESSRAHFDRHRSVIVW